VSGQIHVADPLLPARSLWYTLDRWLGGRSRFGSDGRGEKSRAPI